jgi:hypothetical protein
MSKKTTDWKEAEWEEAFQKLEEAFLKLEEAFRKREDAFLELLNSEHTEEEVRQRYVEAYQARKEAFQRRDKLRHLAEALSTKKGKEVRA